VFDANIFYSRPLTDIALRLVEKGLFGFVWSEQILGEAHRNLVADGKCSEAQALRRKPAIREAFPESEALPFDYLLSSMDCNEKDRHVLAAAIVGSANQIVTFNLTDFPAAVLARHGVEAIHPDDFFLNVLDLYTRQVVSAVREQSADLNRPPLTVFDVIRAFSKSGCPNFAQELANIERAGL
jgi:hypothetical protein